MTHKNETPTPDLSTEKPPNQAALEPEPSSPLPSTPLSTPRRGRRPEEVSPDDRKEIIRLHSFYGSRTIADRVPHSRKVVRRVLEEEGLSDPPAQPPTRKLEPYHQCIEDKAKKGLTTSRILREVKELGYTGERTILASHVREVKARLPGQPKTRLKRRFETAPGEEMQIDWSPYRVLIGGVSVLVHALGVLLCSSRKLYLRCYRDERQSTLLEGLASAFEYFDGVAHRVVLDNMSTAVLGRFVAKGKALFHPRFLDFARHYGFEPFPCRIKDPDRKGKKEKSFRLVYDDFIKGSEFNSWDDLDVRRRTWLDDTPQVANLRIHGTTRRVPNEAFALEHPLLIKLPAKRFPVHEDSIRSVDDDSTLFIHGTPYTVPAQRGNHSVAVRLYAEHFEVMDKLGHVTFSRRYATGQEAGRLQIDKTHYATLPHRPAGRAAGSERLDEAFLRRFPSLGSLVEGITRRMKALAHVHIRALLRLVERYGEDAFLAAATRAQDFRRYDALAVERILEHDFPPPEPEPVAPIAGIGPVVLGEVESGSLDTYAPLDDAPAISPDGATRKGDKHGS
jgi:transposase